MNVLPLEIIHHILEYTGKIKYRNGKYMNQIATDDDRYKILQTIPQLEPHKNQFWYMTISNKSNKLSCEKHISVSFYLKKELILVGTYSDKRIVSYSYYNQGFFYNFTIIFIRIP